MAFMPNKTTLDDDPDQQPLSDLDPRIKDYLTKQMQSASAEQTPEYRQSLRQDVGAAADQKRSNNFAALLANSAAKIGQIGGKESDPSAMEQFAKASNAGVDQSMDTEAMKPQGLDPKVLDYVKSRQNSQQMARDRAAMMQQQAQLKADQIASEEKRAQEHNETMKGITDTRVQSQKDIADARAEAAAAKGENNTLKGDDKRFDDFDKRIAGTVRDAVGAEKVKLRSSTHAMGVLDQYPDLNQVTNKQALEIAGAMAGTLTPGSPAEHTISQMTPESAQGDLAKALEYVTGKPQGAGLGAQLQLYKEMLQRQQGISADIIGNEIAPHVENYSDLRTKNKKKFDSILGAAGVSLDDDGHYKAYAPHYMRNKAVPAAPAAPGGDGQALAAPKKTYNDGDTKNIGGQPYVRKGGQWFPQQNPAAAAGIGSGD